MKGIRQLANHLNISIGTVSRALNDKPDVSEETRRRVLEAAGQVGYIANRSARALRKGSTGVIGLIIQTEQKYLHLDDSFLVAAYEGIQSALGHHNIDLVPLISSSNEDPAAFLERFIARGFVDGVIFSPSSDFDNRAALLARHQIPFATLGRRDADIGQRWIDLDFQQMSKIAVARFAKAHHKQVAIIHSQTNSRLSSSLFQALKKCTRHDGVDSDLTFKELPSGIVETRDFRRIMKKDTRPTAFITLSGSSSAGLYDALREIGHEPGRDVSIIGINDARTTLLSPRLTCFDFDFRALGMALAQCLLVGMPKYAVNYSDLATGCIWQAKLMEGQSG